MLRLSKMSILPCRFLKLRNDLPPCVSCLFGQAHRWPWRYKSSAKSSGGVIRSSDLNKPGKRFGIDLIVSSQSILVPQENLSMERAHIWGDTVFVDYATRWVKEHLIQDTSGDFTLKAKEDFELDCTT